MNPVDWAIQPLRKYAVLDGRAPRAEYWWFTLGAVLIGVPLGLVDMLLLHSKVWGDYGPLGLLVAVALFVPRVALFVRRLHDIDRSAWWALTLVPTYALILTGQPFARLLHPFEGTPVIVNVVAALAYLIAVIIAFIFSICRGTEGPNAYGSDPYGPNQLEEVFA